MVLTLDIGNFEITLGGFDDGELFFVAHIGTDTNKTADEYAVSMLSVLTLRSIDRSAVNGSILSSVVPELNPVIKKALVLLFGKEPLSVCPGIKTGIGIRCDSPSSVGGDLICAAVAAVAHYGSPALIVDIDTATKISVVDGTGSFVGTSIFPGILMCLGALSEKAALLPTVELSAPSRVIAKNTADCMRSGIIYGNASMIDGMIRRVFAELGTELRVIVTGSQAELVTPYLEHTFVYDAHLVLRGLYAIYNKNN